VYYFVLNVLHWIVAAACKVAHCLRYMCCVLLYVCYNAYFIFSLTGSVQSVALEYSFMLSCFLTVFKLLVSMFVFFFCFVVRFVIHIVRG
jgi:hypothetical protein